MNTNSRDWLIGLGLAIVPLALIGLGVLAGRYTVTRNFSSKIEGVTAAHTMSSLLNEEEQRQVSKAYYEPDSMMRRFDDVPLSVPNSPTPFVGSAPTPGVHPGSRINSMQFRFDREIELPRPPDTYRIFITGGSTAFGTGAIDQDRTIGGFLASILEKELSPETGRTYEVVTAANPAWASTQERIFIENRLSELEPDLIISVSGNNDVHWGKRGRNVLWYRTYSDQYFFALVRDTYRASGRRDFPEIIEVDSTEVAPELVASRLTKNVDITAYVLAAEKIEYVFALQPTLALTHKRLTARESQALTDVDYFRRAYALVDSSLAGLAGPRLHYVSLTDIFDELDEQTDVFIDSYHFGDRGNEMIARRLYEEIRDRVGR